MTTTVKFNERERVLLTCIQETVLRNITPQQCTLICRFITIEDTLYLITVYNFGYVTVENASIKKPVDNSLDSNTESLENTLYHLLIE